MTDFSTLDPEARLYALVGKFLFEWSYMESRMHEAIKKALDLDAMQTAILTSNIMFRDKVHILKTTVYHAPIHPEPRKVQFKKLLDEIANYASTRNMIVHTPFVPSRGGVKFMVAKAKGELKFPSVVWKRNNFEEAYEKLERLGEGVDEITKSLETASLIRSLVGESQEKRPRNVLAEMMLNLHSGSSDPNGDPAAEGSQ